MADRLARIEKIASIFSGLAGVLATIAIAVAGFRISANDSQRTDTERQVARIAQLGPLLLDQDPAKQEFALNVVVREGVPEELCATVLSAIGNSNNGKFRSLGALRGCSKAEVLSILATTADPSTRQAAASLIAQGTTQKALEEATVSNESASVASSANQILQDNYEVIVASSSTEQGIRGAVGKIAERLKRVGLTPICLKPAAPGRAYGVALAPRLVSFAQAQENAQKVRDAGFSDAFLYPAARNGVPSEPFDCL